MWKRADHSASGLSPPGIYHVQAANLPPGFYVKSARPGDAGGISMRLDLLQPPSGALTVVASSRGSALVGNVESDRAGLQVFVIAEGNPWWSKAAVTGDLVPCDTGRMNAP